MKELEDLFEELRKYLETKEFELRQNINFNSYTQGLLLNRQKDIEDFHFACININKDPFLKKEIIENFINTSAKIKSEIDMISC